MVGLPTIDSFTFKASLSNSGTELPQKQQTFTEILGLEDFLYTPVRQLSLGQRMRADIAASLLHDPAILFLDEPTIGLDVVAKDRMRKFIREINKERGVTVILTTHDMSDIEKLCKRMILIDIGKIMYDGDGAMIMELFGRPDFNYRLWGMCLFRKITTIRAEGNRKWLSFQENKYCLLAKIGKYEIKDHIVQEPEIDYIIRKIYERGL